MKQVGFGWPVELQEGWGTKTEAGLPGATAKFKSQKWPYDEISTTPFR